MLSEFDRCPNPKIQRGVWRRSRACAVLTFIINVRHSHTKWPPWEYLAVRRRSRECVLFMLTFILNVRHSHIKWPLGECGGVRRHSCACAVLIFSFPGCSWLLLAAPGCLLAAPGCSWLVCMLVMSTVDPKKTNCFGFYAGIITRLACSLEALDKPAMRIAYDTVEGTERRGLSWPWRAHLSLLGAMFEEI
jgi:hypothetical protein